MSARFCSAFFVGLLAAASAPGQDRLIFQREKVLPVTMQLAASGVATPALSGRGLIWRGRISHPAAVSSIRLHVVVSGHGDRWQLVVRSETTGVVVETYDSMSRPVRDGSFWTRDVPGSAALVDLQATGDCGGLSIAIDQYAFETTPSTQQAIHGIDGRLAIVDASARLQALGRPVARLRIMIPSLGQATCTGFLVSDSLLFTNQHCVESPAEARSTLADLGYDQADMPFETMRVDDLLAVSHDLDYALLHLERPAAARWTHLDVSRSPEPSEGEQLVLLEHPLGGYKQVSLESCEVSGVQMPGVTATPTDFGHKCDTLNGSSGSPVLDESSGAVIGLHHFGFDVGTNTFVNRAVRIGLILADVRKQRPTVADDLLR